MMKADPSLRLVSGEDRSVGYLQTIPGLKSETWGTQFLNDESGSFVAFSHPSGEDLSVGYLQTIRGLKSETWGTQFLDRL